MSSIEEFISASADKNIMCEQFPYRRAELDLYEKNVVDMSTRYGWSVFYEYLKHLSAISAAYFQYNNRPIRTIRYYVRFLRTRN